MTVKRLIFRLLGGVEWLEVGDVRFEDKRVRVRASSTQMESRCPVCGVASQSVHSHYDRTLGDLPWGGLEVEIFLKVRRFRCGQGDCRRKVFAERFLNGVVSYARRVCRLSEVLGSLGILAGGTGGARISRLTKVKVSPSTILRRVQRLEIPQNPINPNLASPTNPTNTTDPPTVITVIGVDDFAFKKRKSYGTVVVNLENRKILDLLPDRTAEGLSAWLKTRPEIKTISRDRSSEYAKGIAEGAPHAQTVLDRFHLLMNLGEVLERVVQYHQGAIKAAATQLGIRPRKRTSKEERLREERRKARHQRYQEIRERNGKGDSINHIMRDMGISRTQVRTALRGDELPERHGNRRRDSILDPYRPHLKKRWDEGVRNASQLFREVVAQGFPGTRKQVYRWAQERREQPFKHKSVPPIQPVQSTQQTQPVLHSAQPPVQVPRLDEVGLASSQLAWLLRQNSETLNDAERLVLNTLLDSTPQLKVAQTLAHQFQGLFSSKKAEQVEVWLKAAIESGLTEFKTFAIGLQREVIALKAAVTLPWSNGPVEGWVNKIKAIKRQMYGRASFDLLRKRVLLSP